MKKPYFLRYTHTHTHIHTHTYGYYIIRMFLVPTSRSRTIRLSNFQDEIKSFLAVKYRLYKCQFILFVIFRYLIVTKVSLLIAWIPSLRRLYLQQPPSCCEPLIIVNTFLRWHWSMITSDWQVIMRKWKSKKVRHFNF